MNEQATASNTSILTPSTTMTGTTGTVAPTVSQPTADDPTKPPAWLGPRLEEAKAAATRALLKQLGAEKPEEIQARLAKAKELEDAQLTEQQRVAKQIDELRAQAAEADRYKKLSSDLAELQFKALTPAEQAALDDLPPLERLPFITRFMRARQAPAEAIGAALTQQTQPSAPTVQTAAIAPPAHNAPPGAPPPPAGTPETAFDRWQKLPAGSTASAMFYRAHQADIDASRK